MKKLVSNILRLSSLESGKIGVERKVFDLTLTANSVITMLKPLADEKGLKLTLSAPQNMKLESDEEKVREALLEPARERDKVTPKRAG